MKQFLLILFLGVGFMSVSRAQRIIPCGTVEYIDELDSIWPGIKANMDRTYLQGIEEVKSERLFKAPPLDTLFDIPVVFHIVYNNDEENIPDSLIHDQIEVLNEAYNRRNADTINTRDVFKPFAGNARISFHLATTDPQGNASSGITRTFTTMETFYNGNGTVSNDFVKSRTTGGVAAWDTEKYLNVWVCDMTFSGQVILLGYAFPPTNATGWAGNSFVPANRQGVVLHYGTVGRNNNRGPQSALNTAEKTAVHEVGHFLGLRHIWGDPRTGQDGCFIDDFIDDTPPQSTATTEAFCPMNKNTCTTENDLPDQIENYMDYSRRQCSNMFTKQQVELMRYNLFNLRPNLGGRIVLEAPGPDIAEVIVYPNPTDDNIQINLPDPMENEMISIRVYDMIGRQVMEQIQTADYVLAFRAKNLASGAYWLEMESDLRGELLKSRIFKRD